MLTRTTFLGLFLLAAMIPSIEAQSGIAGKVRDASGAVLPGAIVEASSPALIEKTRMVQTDGRGEYKIVGLRPGTYSLGFTAPGFTRQDRQGIVLTADFVAEVNADMQVGPAAQRVDVQSEVSSLDVQSSTQQEVLTRAVMDEVPTGHSVFSDAQTIPGATLSRPDVGGSTGMQQTTLQIHGSNGSDTAYQIDGMLVNQNSANSSFVGVYYNDGMIQETSYQTSAIPAEVSKGGIRINMIAKDGGNQFHGSFYGTGATGVLESNNVPAGQIASGVLKAGNRFSSVYDVNGSVGGPIVKDKLWFFSSVRRWSVNEYVANTFDTNGAQAIDDNHITDAILRLTWQINSKNKLSAFYDKDMKLRGHRRDLTGQYSFIDTPASVTHSTPLAYLSQARWTSTLSPKWVVEAGLSMSFDAFALGYQPGIPSSAIATIDLARSTLTNAGEYDYISIASRREVSASTSYVTGSHNIKFGFQDSFAPYRESYSMRGDIHVAFYNGVPDVAYLYNTPINSNVDLNADLGLYAQDSWTFRRLTVNGGVRWEYFDASIQPQSAGAGTWVPARSYQAVPNLPNWKTVVPRLGLSYNLFGKGTTVLKASASKYEQGQGVGLPQTVDPMFLASETCTWTPPPGTTPAAMGTNGQSIVNASVFTNCTGFNGAVNAHFGNHVTRPFTWEYTAAIQQEILPQFVVSASYFYRQSRNNLGVANTDAPSADYTPYTITNPLTGEPLTVYNESPADKGRIYLLETNYKQLDADYNGVDLIAKKVFSGKGAFVQAALTIGRLYGSTLGVNNPSSTDLNNPNLLYNSIGAVGLDSTYQFRITGAYPLPWHFKVAGNYQHLTGQPFTPLYTVNTTLDPGLTQLSQSINLVKPGSERLPPLNLLDLRFSRIFSFGERWKFEPMADIYNVLNVDTPYAEVATVGANLGHYSANTEGRILKLGLQVNF